MGKPSETDHRTRTAETQNKNEISQQTHDDDLDTQKPQNDKDKTPEKHTKLARKIPRLFFFPE